MKRLAFVLGLVAVVALLSLSHRPAEAADPTIKEIMTKAHKGGNSLITTVGKELKEDTPPWADVQKQTKELVELGSSLGKNDPPKGDKESWKKLTDQYVTDAKALDAAAQKKDKDAATKAHTKLTGQCMACHRAHRPAAN
jgi:cytochrome c556